jgi:hypothetical protein
MICGVMTTLEAEIEPPFGTKLLDLVGDSARGQGQIHYDRQ